MQKELSFAFFGTPQFAVTILEEMKSRGFVPKLIVTQEDKPQGRHMEITPPPTKVWARSNNIPVYQPQSLRGGIAFDTLKDTYNAGEFDVFIVASYGKIIPDEILSLPKRETINVHPSLLPKLRGSSPILGAILEEEKTGVTIMHLDSEMDHGPIIAQREISVSEWPPYAPDLENLLAREGGKLLSEILPLWVDGSIKETAQDHTLATYTKKVKKEDAEIDLSDDAELNIRKIRGYAGWPNAFTFFEQGKKRIRVIIKTAEIVDGKLILLRVIPEGKKEMGFDEFERGLHKK